METDATSVAIAPKMHVLRAILFGIGAELLTILSIVLAVMVYRAGAGHTAADLARYSAEAGLLIGPAGGAIFTFLMAVWALRGVGGRYLTHGLIVAAAAIALHLLGVSAAPGGLRAIYLVADVFKLVAGLAAGLIVARSRR
jgi:hypothetical protein